MDKNTITAVALSGFFLIIWFLIIQPKMMPRSPLITKPPQTSAVREAQPVVESEKVAEHLPIIPEEASPEKDILIETPRSRILFTTRGGSVKKWEINDISGWVDLVYPPQGNALMLATFPEALFMTSAESKKLTVHNGTYEVVFSLKTEQGLSMTKTFRIRPEEYMVEVLYAIKNDNPAEHREQEWSIGWGPGLNTFEREQKENTRLMRVIGYSNGKVISYKAQTVAEQCQWIGIDNRYFLAALIPASYEDFSKLVTDTGKKTSPSFAWHTRSMLAPLEKKNYVFKFYAGPKGYIHLKKLGFNLEESVNFGFFGVLGKWALHALYFFQKLTGNYGWAIILLTICLQIIFIPLTLKSFKANLSMKKLQPQIKALQAKFKSDPKRLNMEIMNLYRTSGTNPFGGCMPMLLQIPVFWALFTTLRNAFELRGAPFILWIKDLSIHDPYYVLPILMGIGMLVQQKTMSVATDPQQARMMTMMPIIFTFFFLKFPAGLVLYWFTNSLLTMGIQFMIMQKNKDSGTAVVQVHAKR